MGGVNGIDLSDDETTLITVGQEKRVTLWDLREHHPLMHRDLSPKGDDEAKGVAVSKWWW